MGVGDENNAYADGGKEDDADGKDADVDGKDVMPTLMVRMPMLMPVVRPPAGTPRASCQLTLLTSPARVTRVGHSGEENCKLEISSML